MARTRAAIEGWFHHRADVEDRIRDAKLGYALHHLPSASPAALGCCHFRLAYYQASSTFPQLRSPRSQPPYLRIWVR
ncbi:MAG TPA: hypothetical protein VGC06_11210 [Actinomycetes bacterium]